MASPSTSHSSDARNLFLGAHQQILGVGLLVVDNDPVLDSPPVELTHLIQDCSLDQFVGLEGKRLS